MPIDAPTIRIPQIVIASALPLGIKRDTAIATAIATAKDSNVALHVNLDKMLELRRETFTA